MIQRKSTITRARPLLIALAVVLLVLPALADASARVQPDALPDPPYAGPGEFCMDDTGVTPLNCTANDTRVSKLTPALADICLVVDQYVNATFKADLVIGAQTRYDLAMYIAADGGPALNGSMCLKEVLQPVAAYGSPGTPLNPDGMGPFANEDDDACGEAHASGTGVVGAYYLLHPISVKCADGNNDGVVDPIRTCLSWANNKEQFTCNGVTATVPGPGTGSKCNCETTPPTPPILIYRGYDWGDLPDTYKTFLASNGPRHAIQNWDNTGAPDTQGGIVGVWLGQTAPSVDYAETDGIPTDYATGDDGNNTDDENGVTWTSGTSSFTVVVNSSDGTCYQCRLGYWVDLNADGDFEDADESYVADVVYGTNTVMFNLPTNPPTYIDARFRLYDQYATGTPSPTGMVRNGEVEDYWWEWPTAVELASFTATPQAWTRSILIEWETVSEVDNLGFNLYRAESPDGRQIRLNASLIPSQGPGSPIGFKYSFADRTALTGRTYYYWLEAVDVYGMTASYGPVSAAIPPQIGVPKPSKP